jgi:hypothetical protein
MGKKNWIEQMTDGVNEMSYEIQTWGQKSKSEYDEHGNRKNFWQRNKPGLFTFLFLLGCGLFFLFIGRVWLARIMFLMAGFQILVSIWVMIKSLPGLLVNLFRRR